MKAKFCWRVRRKSDYQGERIKKTIDALPADARSILDVGCNQGLVSNHIDSSRAVIGLDLDFSAVRKAACVRVCGDARVLPVRDRSVDLVMLTECLEHLDDAGLARACAEAERVARNYLLVSVPWRQNLDIGTIRCGCGNQFHAYGHIQRFDESVLCRIFHDFTLSKIAYAGECRPTVSIVPRLRQRGGRYASSDDTVCVVCGSTEFPWTPRNGWTAIAGLIDTAIAMAPMSVPIWVLALYRRIDLKASVNKPENPRDDPPRLAEASS